MAKKRPPPRIGTRRQQVWRKVPLPSYGWYVSIYMCPYLHCCTYGKWMVVLCMVYLLYIRVHNIFIDVVHTVWSLSYYVVWWHWSYIQYLPCKWSLYILSSYVWYIHMYPYLHYLTYSLCRSKTVAVHMVVLCMVCMFPYLLRRTHHTFTVILCMVGTYVSISSLLYKPYHMSLLYVWSSLYRT